MHGRNKEKIQLASGNTCFILSAISGFMKPIEAVVRPMSFVQTCIELVHSSEKGGDRRPQPAIAVHLSFVSRNTVPSLDTLPS